MKTECSAGQLEFQGLGRRAVVGEFDGGKVSSDSGGLLLCEVEQRTHILKRLAGCFTDHRDATQVEHSLESLLKQGGINYKQKYFCPDTFFVTIKTASPSSIFQQLLPYSHPP